MQFVSIQIGFGVSSYYCTLSCLSARTYYMHVLLFILLLYRCSDCFSHCFLMLLHEHATARAFNKYSLLNNQYKRQTFLLCFHSFLQEVMQKFEKNTKWDL